MTIGDSSVPREDWQWFGNAGHFICSPHCRFHLCTKVGDYLVSTVGEYVPDSQVMRVLANSRNAILPEKGDAVEHEFLKRFGFEEIGYDRKYETMVWRAGPPCEAVDCGCGIPGLVSEEVDMLPYNSAGEATKGHMALCEKWAAKEKETPDA